MHDSTLKMKRLTNIDILLSHPTVCVLILQYVAIVAATRGKPLPLVIDAWSAGCSETGSAIFLKTLNAVIHSSLSLTDEQPNVSTTSSATSSWEMRERESERERERERCQNVINCQLGKSCEVWNEVCPISELQEFQSRK